MGAKRGKRRELPWWYVYQASLSGDPPLRTIRDIFPQLADPVHCIAYNMFYFYIRNDLHWAYEECRRRQQDEAAKSNETRAGNEELEMASLDFAYTEEERRASVVRDPH